MIYMVCTHREQQARSVTLQGLAVNLILTALKFLAGIFGRSAAMVADAVHSLSDTATDIVVLVSLRFSAKPADEDHAYGHGRFETLATAVIALALAAVGIKILLSGVNSITSVAQGHVLPAPGFIALAAALISIIAKEWLYRYTVRAAKRIDSQALLANAWHHRSDAFSSIGTLAGISGAYFLGPKWTVLDPLAAVVVSFFIFEADPLAAVVVSFFIFEAAWQILKNVWQELSDGSLGAQAEKEIRALCAQVPHVVDPHEIKTRRIGPNAAIELHIYVADDTPFVRVHEITEQVESRLRGRFGPGTFVTVHPEPLSSRNN